MSARESLEVKKDWNGNLVISLSDAVELLDGYRGDVMPRLLAAQTAPGDTVPVNTVMDITYELLQRDRLLKALGVAR